MTYAAVSDLTTRFGVQTITELSDPANTGTLQASVINQALSDADDLINGYIVKVYQLPLASVPTILIGIECDIALYKLYADLPTDTATKRYNDAITRLRDIAAGKFALDVAGVETPQQPDLVAISSQPRRLSRQSLRDW